MNIFDIGEHYGRQIMRSARSIRKDNFEQLNFEIGYMSGLRSGLNIKEQQIDPAIIESAMNIAFARCRGISA